MRTIPKSNFGPKFKRSGTATSISVDEAMDYPRFDEDGKVIDGKTTSISVDEAMDYPRFDEDGNVIDGKTETATKSSANKIEYATNKAGDDSEQEYDIYYEGEIDQVAMDMFDDGLDYARSEEEGWYYSDDD